jgi:hypothetical protein
METKGPHSKIPSSSQKALEKAIGLILPKDGSLIHLNEHCYRRNAEPPLRRLLTDYLTISVRLLLYVTLKE